MVDGCGKIEASCVVVDLDGTLLRGNSMREMIRFMLRESIREREYGTIAMIISLLALRKSGVISHRQMKYPIHRMARKWLLNNDRLQRLTDILISLVNREVCIKIDDLRKHGTKVVIATAAPDIYISEFLKRMGYDEFIATPLTTKLIDYKENRGENKRQNVENLSRMKGWHITHVFTDHIDDLPLLMLPVEERILVSPSANLCDKLRNLNLSFSVIK